ncbi:diguanylate cyclase (GGDEF) domain-containing protein [Fibrobacter sp. UWH5]|nr:diguanylate cyclase (GGDEF) domain-containing protein [Fibrobacter sp. UWH5]
MFTEIKSFLVNAHMNPQELRATQEAIDSRNRRTLNAFSLLSMAAFAAATAAALSADINGISQKATGYIAALVLSIVIFLANKLLVPRFPQLLHSLEFAFECALYAAGMFLTFVNSPEQLTITLFGMYLIVPQLFATRPFRVTVLTIVVALSFIALYYGTDIKPAAIRMQEIVNSTIFSCVGIFLGCCVKKALLERFVFEHRENLANSKERKMQLLQWKSMANIYISMAQVDMDTDEFTMMRTNQFIQDSLPTEKNFTVCVKKVMEATTDPDYLEEVLAFTDMTTLKDRLRDKNTITHEFLGKHFGWCRARFIAVKDSEEEVLHRVIYVVENIDEQKNREAHLTSMAETDAMTGLFNRQAGSTKIKEKLFNKVDGMFCLFDIDKFKQVNDTLGHQAGDEVIIATAKALRKAFRDNDILMRLGGDEFVLFAKDITTEELGARVIQRFFNTLENTQVKGLEDYRISVSLGATIAKGGEANFDELYKQADACTYESKKVPGKSFTFYRG